MNRKISESVELLGRTMYAAAFIEEAKKKLKNTPSSVLKDIAQLLKGMGKSASEEVTASVMDKIQSAIKKMPKLAPYAGVVALLFGLASTAKADDLTKALESGKQDTVMSIVDDLLKDEKVEFSLTTKINPKRIQEQFQEEADKPFKDIDIKVGPTKKSA
jgi:hypothetical protein